MEAAVAVLVFVLACGGIAWSIGERIRRRKLNRSLHELRRPAQLLALLACRDQLDQPALRGYLDQLALGLEDLEREVNGGAEPGLGPVTASEIAETAERRWGWNARIEVEVGEEAVAEASAPRIAAVVDNLVANSLEHGTGRVRVRTGREGDHIALSVRDDGPRSSSATARAVADPRRGHGSGIVARTIAERGGRLERAEGGHLSGAVLPISGGS